MGREGGEKIVGGEKIGGGEIETEEDEKIRRMRKWRQRE